MHGVRVSPLSVSLPPHRRHSASLNAQPALVADERKLREKITILALMEIIARLPTDEHVVSLKSIAERTKLSVDGAEFLVMKTLRCDNNKQTYSFNKHANVCV